MAKDRKKLIHMHSSVPDKQPTAASLEVGEIAVNNAKDQEFLSLKNSEDKVVRFSSDEQIVTIMEKKEVMPYKGYVRGETGPSSTSGDTPTADTYGSYGITNNDLLNNKSNIIIKLNQVVAGNTIKHDKVNGAKDKYNKDVNPTDDGGLTDGAGFFIDMSRYAMQDANPQFSSTTNTCRTTLSGTTIIRGLDGSCGSLLDAKVATEVGDFGTATNKIGTATTTISADTTLTVSGNTTETHNGPVVITNNNNKTETTKGSSTANTSGNSVVNVGGNYSGATTGTTIEIKIGNVVENHSGTTTETKAKDVTENNLSAKTETTTGVNTVNNKSNYNVNTSGNTTILTTGNTVIHSDGKVGISAKGELSLVSSEDDIIITADDDICETAGNKATFYGVSQTNVGLDCDDTSASTTTNVYGKTLNVYASTANTNIATANTSATTATLSGNSLTITENTTDITSCGHLYLNTNDFKLQQCSGSQGSAELKFCNGFKVDSNAITLEECPSGAGSITIKETTSTISGTNLTINEGDDVKINVGDDFIVNTSGDTTITTTGETKITSTSNVCVTSNADANFGGDINTRIGANCSGTSGYSNNTYITASSSAFTYAPTVVNSGTTNNNTFTTINNSATTINNTATTENNKITTINTTASTINTTATTINQSGDTYNVTAATEIHTTTSFTVNSSSAACIVSNDVASVGGDVTTNIGANCNGTAISNTTNIYGDTLVESGTTNNNTFTTINNTANTINQSGVTYNITGDTNINGTLCIASGLCKTLSWTYGDVKTNGGNAVDSSTNFKEDKAFVVPRCVGDMNRSKFGYSYGDVHGKHGDTGGTYDPGEACNNQTTDSVVIPTSIQHINEWSQNCFTIDNNLCVTGNITATGSVFSTSDERKKENINFIDADSKLKVRNIPLKSFNFKEDLTKRKVYGVIAQEVEEAGLDELVHTDEEGMKSVDYTSFLILRIAYLEKMIGHMHSKIVQLEGQINEK